MVRLVQIVDLSCTKTNTISKWTETRFYMTHISSEFHPVCPKRFPSLWYVRRKPFTYLESRFALSPNKPKRASIWASSPWSTSRCIQNEFWGYGTFGANCAPILHWNKHCLQTDRNKLSFEPHHVGLPSGVSKTISVHTVRLAETVHLSYTETNTVSKIIKTRFYMPHVS
jgi:hypothetical protein